MNKYFLPLQQLALASLFLFVATTNTVVAQDEVVSNLTSLIGQEIDIRMKDGSLTAFATVKTADAGEKEGSIKNLKVQFRDSKRIKSIPLSKVIEFYKNDLPLDVAYDRKSRTLSHSVEKRIDREEYRRKVEKQLAIRRDEYWKPLTDKQHTKFLETHRAFIEKTKDAMPRTHFRLVETEFFMFLTDLTSNEVDGYILYLDEMYRRLCFAFGLSPQKNIWCGKCVVVAFAEKNDYLRFEAVVMENGKAEGSQGLCHQFRDGRVVFAGFKGDNGFFGHVLVHETAHGFVHRYMSTARAPSWLNEGMSDWLANVIVKGNKIPLRQKRSAQTIIQQGGWGNFLTADQIDGDHYGAASTMVEILLARNKDGNFKRFFDGIKEGKSSDESLKDAFGISYQDLKILYAQVATRQANQK